MHKLHINSPYAPPNSKDTTWSWPLDPSKYDRSSALRADEKSALAYLVSRQRRCGHFPLWVEKSLHRLTTPIDEVMTTIMEMLSRMLMESRRETVQLLTNYEESYHSHDMVYIEIEKQDPLAASRAMVDHFAIMEARAKKAGLSMDAAAPTSTKIEDADDEA